MRLKELEIMLESIERLKQLDSTLEQYPTPASIVASILYSAQMDHDDIFGRTVFDLGCGDGIFAIGAALLGAKRVVGVDIQSKALKVSQRNAILLGTEGTTDWVLSDVASLEVRSDVDTVVTNPPFGVKQRGADVKFLKKTLSLAKVAYSIHLAGDKNRRYLLAKIDELGGIVTQIESFDFPMGHLYEFHRKRKHVTRVDLYRICVNNGEEYG